LCQDARPHPSARRACGALDAAPDPCYTLPRQLNRSSGTGKAVQLRCGPAAVSEDERPRRSHCSGDADEAPPEREGWPSRTIRKPEDLPEPPNAWHSSRKGIAGTKGNHSPSASRAGPKVFFYPPPAPRVKAGAPELAAPSFEPAAEATGYRDRRRRARDAHHVSSGGVRDVPWEARAKPARAQRQEVRIDRSATARSHLATA
jgi:hypothetical protein